MEGVTPGECSLFQGLAFSRRILGTCLSLLQVPYINGAGLLEEIWLYASPRPFGEAFLTHLVHILGLCQAL